MIPWGAPVHPKSRLSRERPTMGHKTLTGLSGSALRGLKGIDFPLSSAVSGFAQVSGHIAAPCSPLDGRIREYEAVSARGEFFGFLAAVALFDDRMAAPAVELTALLVHEEAVHTRFNRCTNHGYHVLSL
jgi:hypothetical protein